MKRTLAALLLVSALSGCLNSFTTSDYNKPVHVGMTEQELVGALGKPEVITKKPDGSQTWVYSFDLGTDARSEFYTLKDGKVIDIPPATPAK